MKEKIPIGARNFSLPNKVWTGSGFFMGARRPQREVSNSSDLLPRLRNGEWSYNVTPPYATMAWTGTLVPAPIDLCSSFFSVFGTGYGAVYVTTDKTGNEGITQHYCAFT
jgi:hypothetical protein